MDMIYWDHYYNIIVLTNLLIVVALFASLRLFSGMISHISARRELLEKDNPAFGISLAGAALGITIMVSGLIYGHYGQARIESISMVAVLGAVGILLMALTRLIFDKITMREISLRDEIVKGNIAVAIADAGNVLAAAIIIRAVMIWSSVFSVESFLTLFSGYAISQILLTVLTLLSMAAFARLNKGHRVQDHLSQGNIALALRFSGQKIGMAFAIAAAAHVVVYEVYDLATIAVAWVCVSLVAVAVWAVLAQIAERLILFRINGKKEVLEQRNIALGIFHAAIFIAIGMMIFSL